MALYMVTGNELIDTGPPIPLSSKHVIMHPRWLCWAGFLFVMLICVKSDFNKRNIRLFGNASFFNILPYCKHAFLFRHKWFVKLVLCWDCSTTYVHVNKRILCMYRVNWTFYTRA